MGFLSSDGQLSPLRKAKDQGIIREWLAAIDSFYDYYSQLCIYANAYHTQESMGSHPMAYIGQCSIDQLDGLLDTMQQQLDGLLLDLDQMNQKKSPWTAEKLRIHTQLLTQLNQQALVVCQLASQSAS